jgi:uncharacterized membrane protein YeiH
MTTPVDSREFSNIAATTAPFALDGGYYMVAAIATFGGGTVKFQLLGPDQATWIDFPTAVSFTANGSSTVYASPGQYRFTIATATAVYCSVAGIPID